MLSYLYLDLNIRFRKLINAREIPKMIRLISVSALLIL